MADYSKMDVDKVSIWEHYDGAWIVEYGSNLLDGYRVQKKVHQQSLLDRRPLKERVKATVYKAYAEYDEALAGEATKREFQKSILDEIRQEIIDGRTP